MKILKKTAQKGFTLVEILVVVAIMALVLGFGAAGIKSMAEGNAIEAGVNQMKSKMKEAQAIAKGRGIDARVVVYMDADDKSKLSMDRYGRFVGVAIRDSSGDWKLQSKGNYLPKGAYLDADKCLKDKDGGAYTTHREDDGTAIPDGLMEMDVNVESGKAQRDFYFWEFNDLGIMVNPAHETSALTSENRARGFESKAPRVILSEGQLRRSGGKITFKAADDTSDERTYAGFYIYRSGNLDSIEFLDSIED